MGERRRSANGQQKAVHDGVPVQQHINETKPAEPGPVRNICVYCGSSPGRNPAYAEGARTLGRLMAESDIGLVYGGGGLGLMGEIAQSVLKHGGRVTGIIPEFLSVKERMLRDATELIVVSDMHQRKKLMFDRSDAFVAMSGGIGTLEELVEQLTWAQLGQHAKPIVLLDIEGFWTPFLGLLDHMRQEGFIRPEMGVTVLTAGSPAAVIPTVLGNARPVAEQAASQLSEKF